MGRAFKVVILGGGTAAGYAAFEFVKNDYNHGELCIISEESVAPYERPALSKGVILPGRAQLPSFHTCVGLEKDRLTPKWYKENGIELILNTKVVSTDLKKKNLLTASQETIEYEKMIIATGARAMKLEEFGLTDSVAPNICYLRDIQDAKKLVEAIDTCKSASGRAVVIGGGYIGMECAAAVAANRVSATMVFPEAHCMARLFTPEIAAFYENYYERKGISFRKGTVISGFERDDEGKVVAVQLRDGCRLPADLVIVGIGIRPNISLFEGQLSLSKGGIKVNGKMQTSDRSVYAVGDVVAFPIKLYGGEMRKLEHVDHARRSAAHAVNALLSPRSTKDYDYLPFFYSRVFTLSWQFFGNNVGTCIMFGEPASEKFGAYWVDKGRVVGGFLEGGSKEEYQALAKLARDQPLVERDVDALARQGLGFAISHCTEPPPPPPQPPSFFGSLTEGHLMLERVTSAYVLQAVTAVAAAASVAGFAYWYGRRRRKW